MVVAVNCSLGACYLCWVSAKEHIKVSMNGSGIWIVVPLPTFILRQIDKKTKHILCFAKSKNLIFLLL